ncbi:phosphosulfolactate synthase [Actinomadura rubrisoli]|uniref:Phosphosulfolactate synthase n=1 Tax=Actinomadura rubrisoli TaxID=2530368 RepID=A0A4R5B371_9ACTN|nr:phosphosulfolactate synthase [Actinomadura rubrisoli]TDD80588.1 phosphosulfolactate synthase [Actinomadura rubrisoli]
MTGLALPRRTAKPRSRGLTMVIDNGLPTAQFTDFLSSFAEYVDLVKFGWGTALVTPDLPRKIEVLAAHATPFMFGGTLFEKYIVQDRFESYRDLCRRHGCRTVEVSNGTIDLDDLAKGGYIAKLADDFEVVAEVGFKDHPRSELLSPSQWVHSIGSDLAAGASRVILEARESGSSGICRPNGELRYGLIEDILRSDLDVNRLIFEAPTKRLQTHFIKRVGAEVNLGNIAFSGVIALETLRLGLRADTLLDAEGADTRAHVT